MFFLIFQLRIIWVVARGMVNGVYRVEGVMAEDIMHLMDM